MVSNETKRAMIEYIKEKAGQPVTSGELARIFAIEDGMAWPKTRAAIKDGMRLFGEELGAPIGADSRGYFLITTGDQYWDYVENLRSRIKSIEERVNLVSWIWKGEKSCLRLR